MGIELKRGGSLFIDTEPLIHFWMEHETYHPIMARLFDQVYEHKVQCIISMMTYAELMALPIRQKEYRTAARCRNYLCHSENIHLYPFDILVADRAAIIRVNHEVKTPVAIQLATASFSGAEYVLTCDKNWRDIKEVSKLPFEIRLLEEVFD
ncbi:MAG: type II toxin-antitoxin system VapC family toxin [Thermodesulfobacteriota bacterium]